MMTLEEKNEYDKIKEIREEIINLVKADGNMNLPRQKGHGKEDSIYERCQWVDIRFKDDDSCAGSILFYEDFRVDLRTGNLHPGRYGYVVFQKWNNKMINRKAPNMLFGLEDIKGVFIPIDKKHRRETDICVLEGNIESKAREVFDSFKEFIYQGEKK